MKNFNFFLGLNFGYRLYSVTDSLSKTLQEKKMSAVSGQLLAHLTAHTFEKMGSDESFNQFYD